MTPEEFEAEVQSTMCIICDCVPYDTPDYHREVRRLAEGIVRELDDPDSETNRIARERNALLDAGIIEV